MELKDLSKLITDQGDAWGVFQKTYDEILEKKASGESVEGLEAKLALINTDMTEIRKSMELIDAKANRPGDGGDVNLTEDQVAYQKGFANYLRTGDGDSRALKELGRKAMNSQNDDQGGYLVLPEMDMVIDRIAPTISAMHRLADTVEIGSAKWEKMVKKSGMAIRWTADGAGGGETTEPTYAKVAIDVHTAEAEPWVFNETLEDAFVNLENDLAEEAAITFAEGSGAAFITGNGVGRPRGIAAYTNVANSAYTWGNVGYILSGKSAAFTSVAPADAVVDLQHALKSQYRPGAAWMCNDATLGVMRQIKDASGSYYLWNPDPAAGFGGRFLGSPVEVDDNLADLAAGSISLAYGNFKRGYKIVNRRGISLIRDNLTTKGQTKFNFTKRMGGGIFNYEAIKLMKFATS